MIVLLNKTIAILQADATITANLTGGVYDQPIMPDPPDATYGPGPAPDGVLYEATPNAFEPDPPYTIRPCASMRIMQRQPHPNGTWGRFVDIIEVWYYAPNSVDGKTKGYAGMNRVRSIFTRLPIPDDLGAGWIVEPANDALPFERTGEFFNAVRAVERFYGTFTGTDE
jgi:hypothetical protein